MIPMSLKKTLIEQRNKLRPRENTANNNIKGTIRSIFNEYTMPNHFMAMRKTTSERRKLNNSLKVSDRGK